ncbi:adenylate/guanylate cyclase domain-containing protein [Sporosarcina obsidiansis]|uniref:adenylate/guanylate cyclase domain-containing protein n=1 Tax=Sporosarcina obsidiansis TaxID=2660748 RepID=UPI001891B168|nr:adenylate/guanylate cyclase domain-containing protein [Sporosarcina obsidiansis]
MKNVLHFRDERVLNLKPSIVWDLLANTNELNKYVGMFPVNFKQFTVEDDQLIRWAETVVFGLIKMKWKEHVFEWVRHSYYSVEREYIEGPYTSVFWSIRLEPLPEGKTRMHLHGDFTCRYALGKVALQTIVYPQLRNMITYALEFEKSDGKKVPLGKMKIELETARLEKAISLLRDTFLNEEMIQALEDTIRFGADEEVTDMQPYWWAASHQFDRYATVELFLFANAAGLLDYDWNLMCPNCRVPKGKASVLKQMTNSVHCELCGVDYELDFDRYVEMKFHVNAAIRQTNQTTFCINGPVQSPHVLGQFRIAPRSKKTVKWPLVNEPIRCRVLKQNDTAEISGSICESAAITYTTNGFTQLTFPQASLYEISNETDQEIVLVIEKQDWDSYALTAREVTSLQLFRDLLGSEVLAPGLQIGVGHMAILFTDLKDSTQLYEQIGDARAYSDVQKHFNYLMKHIKEHKGTVVKTIGDSIMGAFTSNLDAFEAAVAIQRSLPHLNEELSQPVQVKVGFHAGSVIAVNANDVLDYFGGTVNKAARIQQQSKGGDVVIHRDLYKQLAEEQPEKIREMPIESFAARLHGFEEQTELVRFSFTRVTSPADSA